MAILGDIESTAFVLLVAFKSAPLVLASSQIKKVSLYGMLDPLSIHDLVLQSYTFHTPFLLHAVMPLNFLDLIKRGWLHIQGTTSLYNDFPAKKAPASMIPFTPDYMSYRQFSTNLCHKLFSPCEICEIERVLFNRRWIILPSVLWIESFWEDSHFNLYGRSHRLSFVPEKPREFST